MAEDRLTIDHELLLSHAAWLRRLAQNLVRDPAAADDLVHDTWRAALERPPRDAASLPRWLGQVMRHFAWRRHRADARRRTRERKAARPELADPAPAPLEQLEIHRRLANAVAALSEPYRTTLVLRYLHGLPIEAIARQEAIAASSVRARLARGLASLREALNEERADGTRGLPPALAALAKLGPHPAVLGGFASSLARSVLMTAKTKMAFGAAALAIVAVLAAAWQVAGRDASDPGAALTMSGTASIDGGIGPASGAAAAGALAAAPLPATPPSFETVAKDFLPIPGVVAVRGRVVGTARRPLAGLAVRLCRLDAGPREAVTDDEGRFTFELERATEPVHACVHARIDAGRVVHEPVTVSPFDPATEIDLGTLAAEAAQDLVVRVIAEGAPVPGARVVLTNGYETLAALADGDGLARIAGVVGGQRTVTASAPRRGFGWRQVVMPRAGREPVEVALHPARTVSLRVLEGAARRPIAGARIVSASVPAAAKDTFGQPLPRPPGDAWRSGSDGVIRIEGAPAALPLHLLVAAPGYDHGRPSDNGFSVAPEVMEAELLLDAVPELAWKLGATPGGTVPADGTPLHVVSAGQAHAATATDGMRARIEGGHLLVTGFDMHRQAVVIVAPDGTACEPRIAWFPEGPRPWPETIAFEPARALTVRVRELGGTAVGGMAVTIRSGGPFAMKFSTLPTDSAGEVTWRGLARQEWTVAFGAHTTGWGPPPVLAVDLREADQVVEHVVGREVEVVCHVTVDGRPRLPDACVLSVLGMAADQVQEDPAAATLSVRCRLLGPTPGGLRPASIQVGADGLAGGGRFGLGPQATGVVRVDVPFTTPPRVRVTVAPPPSGACDLVIVRLDEGGDIAETRSPTSFERDDAGGAVATFSGTDPGTWIALDRLTGASAEPLVLESPATEGKVRLDLGRVAVGRGRVEVPRAADLAGARVERVVPALGALAPLVDADVVVASDGSFEVALPGEREVVLRAKHPVLASDPAVSELRVVRPLGDLVLRLVDAAAVRIAVRHSRGLDVGLEWRTVGIRVRPLTDGAAETALVPAVEGAHLVFGLPGPGRYRMTVTVNGFAPATLEAVDVGPGVTELGPVLLEDGERIEVAITYAERLPMQLVRAVATALDGTGETQESSCMGPATVTLTGLRPGRWRVRVSSFMQYPIYLNETVEVRPGEVPRLTCRIAH